MTSIKVCFRPSSSPNNEGRIYYRVIHGRKSRRITTEYRVRPSEWDEKRCQVKTGKHKERRKEVISIREKIKWDMERFYRILGRLDKQPDVYTVDDVVGEFKQYEQEFTFFNYIEAQAERLRLRNKIRTAETYVSALRSFKKYRNNADLVVDTVTPEIMEEYEGWLIRRNLTLNTISFYMRILRAVYNCAVEEGITVDRAPFRHVYTGIDKTLKRAIPLSIIRKIKKMELKPASRLDFARDIFLLSFMLRGMSFVDMAYLRKSDLCGGRVVYRRRKTGQLLTVAWTKEMQAILNKYPANSSDYLLPIIRRRGTNERCVYRNASYSVNRSLKIIGSRLNLEIPLTLYVARHSWASVARNQGIPVSIISSGMGHMNENTTRIYLASLDTTVVDKANSKILKCLN